MKKPRLTEFWQQPVKSLGAHGQEAAVCSFEPADSGAHACLSMLCIKHLCHSLAKTPHCPRTVRETALSSRCVSYTHVALPPCTANECVVCRFQVCTEGRLIVEFTFDDLMRIKTWHFTIRQYRELVPRSILAMHVSNFSTILLSPHPHPIYSRRKSPALSLCERMPAVDTG